jgi:hemerythrin
MTAFVWDVSYETGLAQVDDQHHGLVDLINRLGEEIGGGVSAPEHLQPFVAALLAYAAEHFADEEAMMRARGVDARHLAVHTEEHRRFLDEVRGLAASQAEPATSAAQHLLDYLVHWLACHILGRDRSMAAQLAAMDAGATAAAAYTRASRPESDAVEPLLGALTGLFGLVTKRNEALARLNQTLEARVAERTAALQEALARLELLAMTDALTGLPNRRQALALLRAAWDEAVATGAPLACLMIDADHFKEVNDACGHDAGDAVLVRLAHTLRDALRTDDWVARLGGDEFFVLCRATDLAGALLLAERVRAQVATLEVATGGAPWRGSVSVGVAARAEAMAGPEALVRAADQAVLAAKRAGKGCVVGAVPGIR